MNEAVSSHLEPSTNILPPTPAGLEVLYTICRKVYPDQVNPLQVTALLKYWLGGPDPLDYISMYANPGIASENIPPHWHYISFGLSDLHGDGRVHDIPCTDGVSGFGFELSFRLKRELEETAPPTWPATLMQALAKYVFQSGNTLCIGDHVSWHCALDNSESRIQHMLMTNDVQLKPTQTPYGSVNFVQIVGICAEELKAAQQWKGTGILDIVRRIPIAGGPWFITDMRRVKSIFELDFDAQEEVNRGFEIEGSNLSGVSARCSWQEQKTSNRQQVNDFAGKIDLSYSKEARFWKSELQASSEVFYESSSMFEVGDLNHIEKLNGIHLVFNLEAGSLLPLAIRGRVRHGRHFTFKSVRDELAITLVTNKVTGTLVDANYPYVAKGRWLQLLIDDELAQDMALSFQVLSTPEALSLPKTFCWSSRNLSVTIVSDFEIL